MSETQSQPKFRGIPVWLDGRELIVPALSLGQFRKHAALLMDPGIAQEELIAAVTAGDTAKIDELRGKIEDRMNKLVPVIGLAIQRNYPDITEEQLWDMIDIASFPEVLKAVQSASGMKQVRPGESQPVAGK